MNIQLSDHFTYNRIIRFCIPPIIMMIFTSIYGVVDGLFVSNFVGKTAFAAVNLIMPFIMVLGGFGFMIGTGGSALVAKTLGEGKKEKANRYFSMMILFTVLCGIVISSVSILFLRPIAYALGATEAMIEDCVVYGRILLISNTAFMLQNVFQSFLAAAEKPKLGLYITIAAGLTNMILDALFIAVFQWGVVGAAVATALSEFVGGLLPLLYFAKPNDSLLRLTQTELKPMVILRTCINGSSELMSSISGSVISMLYNFQLLRFTGENGVAAYGVIMYVQFVFMATFFGYTIGMGPVISYHYGADNREELKGLLKKSLILNGAAGLFMVLLSQLLAGPFARIFVGYDAALFEMTQYGFRVFAVAYLLSGLNIFASAFFTALNDGVVSAAIAFLRLLVFQMIFVLILPELFGLDGIWWSKAVGEAFAFLCSLLFLIANRKKYHYA